MIEKRPWRWRLTDDIQPQPPENLRLVLALDGDRKMTIPLHPHYVGVNALGVHLWEVTITQAEADETGGNYLADKMPENAEVRVRVVP
jgi:hypothetical protein